MAVGQVSTPCLVKLISFLFWTGLYLQSSINRPSKAPEWSSRLVTLLHGSVGTIVGLAQCGIMNLGHYRLNMQISTRQYALMVWSWGYFAFDLLWCVLHQPEGRLNLIHHSCALIAITLYMHKDFTGCTFACNLALMEITNPLLQTRWFLKYEGYQKTRIFLIVEATYVTMFLFVRGVLGSYLVYKIMESEMFDLDEKIISVVFYFVSIALMYDVMGYVLHKYHAKLGVLVDDLGTSIIHP